MSVRPQHALDRSESAASATWRIRSKAWRARFPLTPFGVLLTLGGTTAAYHYGIQRLDLVLLSLGLLIVTVVMLGLVTTGIGTWLVQHELQGSKPRNARLNGECGHLYDTGFSLRHRWYLPLLQVEWSWEDFDDDVVDVSHDKHGSAYVERVYSRQRLSLDRIRRVIRVGDIFGTTAVTLKFDEPYDLQLQPTPGALRGVQVVQTLAGGDSLPHPEAPANGERVDMRQYAYGDPIRFLLWKVYARSRELVVRTPERALAPSEQTVAYLVCGSGDEPSSAAARLAIEQGALGGDWRFGVDGDSRTHRNIADATSAIASSGNNTRQGEDRGGKGLARFLKDANANGCRRVILFVPSEPGPWIDTATAAVQSGIQVRTIVCTDGIHNTYSKETRSQAAKQWLLQSRPQRLAPWASPAAIEEEVQTVIEQMRRVSSDIHWLDRTTGGIYGQSHQLLAFANKKSHQHPTTRSHNDATLSSHSFDAHRQAPSQNASDIETQ